MSEFVHLHLHTDYSMLDGACDVEKLCHHVKELGMPAVAMTDHGNIFGAVHFVNAASKAGIKPIIGCELYVCKKDDHRIERTPPEGDTYNHLLVLAENEEGYRNLVKITSEASLHGFYYKPRVSKAFLAEHSKGLIALSGCLKGEVAEFLMEEKYEAARQAAATYGDIFGKQNFFLEIQDQGLEMEHRIHPGLFRLEKDLGLPLVATNDSHYLCEDDAHAQDVMVCIQTGKSIRDTARMKFEGTQFFVKSHDEMYRVFKDSPEVLTRTLDIAERCSLRLEKVATPFPQFDVPPGYTIASYFVHASREGFARRLETLRPLHEQGKLKHSLAEYEQRLERELAIIQQMKFPGYFLIVWDFIRYAKEHDIPVGPGRGSAAGSLVSYALGITDLDPIQHELLFERFLNPERVSMPDIDIDFCMNGRDRVIDYVAGKYGRDRVSQIITYGTMAAKAVVRDVGRVLGMTYGYVDKIAKLIPFELGITLDDALTKEPELKRLYDTEDEIRNLIDLARSLEGLTRNAGMHAGGVVIAPSVLTDFAPLYCDESGGNVVTQFDKDDVEAAGLVKFDFLGLRTLTIIHSAVATINRLRAQQGEAPLDVSQLPMDDARTFAMLKACSTTAVFQLESRGMKDLVRRLQPDRFEDIVALVALFRPGPLQSGMVDDFISRKHGRSDGPIDYLHPSLKTIMEPTYGVILYQEQVMQIAQVLAGYTLGGADLLRRAMGKKKPEEMAKQRSSFVDGSIARGVDPKQAAYIFDLMEKFAGYGFNKSHSAAYALLSYQTAYLKAYYPAAFMAAVLSADMDHTDKVVTLIDECAKIDLAVQPPDINFSRYAFAVADERTIRYGLGAIKGVGRGAVDELIAQRHA